MIPLFNFTINQKAFSKIPHSLISAVFRSDPPSPFRFAVSVQIRRLCPPDPPSLSSRSTVSVLNRRLRPDSSSSSRSTKQSRSRLKTSNTAESVSFSSDKKYDITQVKAPPQLQKTMC
ncbi:hypothetical protein IGI04_034387 [Brassica rapa subsp. trilocularis]|uniref:Uncharacterized protein n=1 Tax=Brassica rapa subsp. trilocularis TaxID=1813537 RepID=A0ABQ7L9J3_BRACM|nr:hypothetical protein IGI04_034387 [Brassica rapa subsp. trilocularis]